MTEPQRPQQLTPYDTGSRLEPHPWVRGTGAPMPRETNTGLVSPDDFGRVDFDDDEGRTVVTVHIERTDHGDHVLHLDNLVVDHLTVTGDAGVIVLSLEHRAGIQELLDLADRGRRDYLDRNCDSQADYDDATLRWVGAHNAAVAIRRQLQAGE